MPTAQPEGGIRVRDDATNVTFWQQITAGAAAVFVLLLRSPPITAA